MSRTSLAPWLRLLLSGGIAAVGLTALWSSIPARAPGIGRPPDGPVTAMARAGWVPAAPAVPAEEERGDGVDESAPPREPEEPPAGVRRYVVVAKDSLWRIAERELGSPRRLGEIERLNPELAGRVLREGMELLLPSSGAEEAGDIAPPPATKAREHTVAQGENLTRIGRRYGVSAEEIFAANRDRLGAIDRVRAGVSLRIPVSGGTARRSRGGAMR
jgi:nucleoid-associated protein YgaU